MSDLVSSFGALTGVAALVAAIVNAGKLAGIVRDGDAPRWAAALNLLAFVALVVLRIYRPDVAVSAVDEQAAQVAEVLWYVLGFAWQIVATPAMHQAFRDGAVPVIGYSHSAGSDAE